MAKHKCLTPGAVYSTKIRGRSVQVKATTPHTLKLSERQAKTLEMNMHRGIEHSLAPHFKVKHGN